MKKSLICLLAAFGFFLSSCNNNFTGNQEVFPESLTVISEDNVVSLVQGMTLQLSVLFEPNNTTNKMVTWASENSEYASVNSKGLVTALAPCDSVKIIATSLINKSISNYIELKITKTEIPANELKIIYEGETEIGINRSVQLEAKVFPENATNKKVIWESSDETIAIVSESGILSTKSKTGKVRITAYLESRASIKDEIEFTIFNHPEEGELEYDLSSDKTYYSVKGIGSFKGEDIVIPAEYNGLPVKAINSYCFKGNKEIKSVTIPESITNIYYEVFSECTNLTAINFNAVECNEGNLNYHALDGAGSEGIGIVFTVGNKVKKLPSYFFYNKIAPKITTFIFEKDSSVKTIGAYFLYQNTYIKEIEIPESVELISDNFAIECSALETVKYNAVSATVKTRPFYKSGNSVTGFNVLIGEKVETIPSGIFASENSIVSEVEFPENCLIKEIPAKFIGCSSLIEKIHIPSSVEVVRANAYGAGTYFSDKLNHVNALEIAGNTVFENGWLKVNKECQIDVTLGEDTTEIGSYVLSKMTLKTIDIKGTISKIDAGAFTESIIKCDFEYPSSLNVIEESVFKSATFEKDFSFPDDLTEIKANAFYNAKFAEENTSELPETVTIIGEYSFYNAKNIYNIKVGQSIEAIGTYAFGFSDIKEAIFGDKIKNIPKYCFYNSAVEKIRFGKGIETYEKNSFQNCKNIKEIELATPNLPDLSEEPKYSSYQNFPRENKEGYSKNIVVTIKNSVKKIPDYFFYVHGDFSEGRIAQVIFDKADSDDQSLIIGKGAFYRQSNLESIELPDHVVSILENAFENCTNAKTISIPAGSINKDAFKGWKAENLFIGETVGEYSFEGNPNLKSVYYNAIDSNIHFNGNSFGIGDVEGYSVTIGKSVKKISRDFLNVRYGNKCYVNDVTFETDSELETIEFGFLSNNDTTRVKDIILPDSVISADLRNVNMNYLYVGPNVKTLNASVKNKIDDQNPFIEFNATDMTDSTSSIMTSVISGTNVNVKIGKNVKRLPKNFLFSSNCNAVYFEKNSECTKIGDNAFREATIHILEIPVSVTEFHSNGIFTFSNIDGIYYGGPSYSELNKILNCNSYSNNLSDKKVYFYSETNTTGKWNRDENGVPILR